jgi:putative transcriptional regulator
MTRLRILTSSLLVALLVTTNGVSAFHASPVRQTASSSRLFSKNSDRARTEHMLEKSMGDDWRSFRAKLVAREHAEKAANKKSSKKDQERQDLAVSSSNSTSTEEVSSDANKKKSDDERELSRTGQLGDMFEAAISTIFKKKGSSSSSSKASKPPSSNSSVRTVDTSEMPALEELLYQDPFASAEELPIHIKPQDYTFDSHRWAHPMDHIEPGCVFLANERLNGVFHHSVVLVVDHHPGTGTTGIVINR